MVFQCNSFYPVYTRCEISFHTLVIDQIPDSIQIAFSGIESGTEEPYSV